MTSEPVGDGLVVAVLGTGTMGAAMARNIAAAGMALRVWNRSRSAAAPLADVGAVVCTSPATPTSRPSTARCALLHRPDDEVSR